MPRRKTTTETTTETPTEKKKNLNKQIKAMVGDTTTKGMVIPPRPPSPYMEIKNESGRLVGIKTVLPWPLQVLRVEKYNVSASIGSDVFYVFDEKGNTYFTETNENHIMTVLERIAAPILQMQQQQSMPPQMQLNPNQNQKKE